MNQDNTSSTIATADIPSILKKIIRTKEAEVATAKTTRNLAAIRQAAIEQYQCQSAPRRGFASALRKKQDRTQPAIIAEIKKASPSKGIISQNFNAYTFAKEYEESGATCLSVLTDEQYFQGNNEYLQAAKETSQVPILRKDFMIDVYQIYESYLMGADCILLIVACLDDDTLHQLHQVACQLGMDVLIEVHTQAELERALKLPNLHATDESVIDNNQATNQRQVPSGQNIYGINNRDLHTFETDLNTSLSLKSQLDAAMSTALSPILVTESGIHSADDMQLMLDNNIYCFLIGEQFMKTVHPGDTLGKLLSAVNDR